MTKYKLLLVVGKAGSGKDTFVKWLMKYKPYLFNKVITNTTRSKRDNEKDNVDYHFLTEKQFLEKEMIESKTFNGWLYGTSYDDLSLNHINILIITPDAIPIYLENEEKFDIIGLVYLYASDKTRLLRQLNIEDEPNCGEICRRFFADQDDFLDFERNPFAIPSMQTARTFIKSNETMEDLANNVLEIRQWINQHWSI